MRKTFLERPTPSFRVIYFFIPLLLSFFFIAETCPEIKKPGDLSSELLKRIEEAVKGFQKPLPEREYENILKKKEESLPEKLKNSLQKSEAQTLYPAPYPRPRSAKRGGQRCGVYYFFSFSMPEEVILSMMKEAVRLNKEGETRVLMVLRGFVKNSLKETIRLLYGYLEKVGEEIPVEIDPELFQRFEVRVVPVLIEEREEKKGIIKGDQAGLAYALSRFKEGLKDYGLFGQLYPIGEEDILRVVASKQKVIEARLREKLPEIKKRMLVLNRYDGQFEHAKKDRVYFINPAVVLSEDIIDHEGNIILRRGEVLSPAQYGIKLGRYVVIDGNSEKQVAFALKGDFRKVILISGDLGKLTKKYRHPFYFANDQLLRRFRIERVPAVIKGEGQYVKVTEKAL